MIFGDLKGVEGTGFYLVNEIQDVYRHAGRC